jgi:hypothetical protein
MPFVPAIGHGAIDPVPIEGRVLNRRERDAAMPDPAGLVLEVIEPVFEYRIDKVAVGIE